jgi:ribose transport system permease protein
MIVIVGLWNPAFFEGRNLITVLLLTSLLLMSALGQTWVILLGSIDLSVGYMASLCSVIFALLVSDWGYGALLIVLLVGVVGGLLNGLVYTLFKIPSFIATLGTGGIFLSLAYVLSNASTVAVSNTENPVMSLLGSTVLQVPVSILLTCLLWAVLLIFQNFMTGGKKLYYIGTSEPASWLSGIRKNGYKLLAFTVSGTTAALTGVLLSSTIYNGGPNLGDPYTLKSIAVVVIGGTALTGGVGGLGRTMIGALIMAILSNGMNVVGVNAYFQNIVTGAVIVLASMLSLDRSKIPMLK